jgi:hypothetical protein
MQQLRQVLAVILAFLMAPTATVFAANHREAPITALDHKADITDVYAFVSYGAGQAPNTPPSKVTLVMCVDPLLEPANGPTWFPFDPEILYQIKVDNDHDAVEDIAFQFRFSTEQRLPGVFQSYVGFEDGAVAPGTTTLVVPPRIDSFDSPGLGLRQSYEVSIARKGVHTELGNDEKFFVVPANVGPRTMNYTKLFADGTYRLANGISLFAGTVDDPFWIDLGATFDTANLRAAVNGGVLTPTQDAAKANITSDTVSGYAVNAIAIEVPIEMLTRDGERHAAGDPDATIGVWATSSRPRLTVRRSPLPAQSAGDYRQVQRMGNPLINELLVGSGYKDRFSMDQPKNDRQFANFFLDPLIARVLNALTGGLVKIPAPPRVDLLPLVTYAPPIAAAGTPPGPVADLLRLNTGVPATPPDTASRLGLLGGDPAGFPNGRRLADDVVDITLRAGVGGVLAAPFPGYTPGINDRLGDGVNVNDAPYRNEFPYFADAPDGRNRRHIDPGEPGCTADTGNPCAN